MMNDGAKAWEIKDYLVSLENCAEVTVEGKSYPGRGALMEQQKRVMEDTLYIWIAKLKPYTCIIVDESV